MALKLKAVERQQYVGKYAGTYRYQLSAEQYNTLDSDKVCAEAALRSGVNKHIMLVAFGALAEVISAWMTEGHNVAVPGMGHLRFGVKAKSVADVNDVASSLIYRRRIIYQPTADIKQMLADTNIEITCYDRNGKIVKRSTAESTEVEDPETDSGDNEGTDPDTGGTTTDPDTGGDDNENGDDFGV